MTSPSILSPPLPQHKYVETGTNARSPELIVQRFSVGRKSKEFLQVPDYVIYEPLVMTSPSPQRFAVSSLSERTSGRSPAGATMLAETPADDYLVYSNRPSLSPGNQSRSTFLRSPSASSTRPGTPDGFNMLTQRTDSMPGMVTPPISSPPTDLRVFDESTRPAVPKLGRLNYGEFGRSNGLTNSEASPALSEQVNWNKSLRDRRSKL